MRFLLIEDEESLRKVIQLNLELEDFEVVCATDGASALEKLEQEYFDLVILDLMLPKLNGLDVLKHLRLRNPELPVIIISARDTSSDRIKGLKTGADDYLVKPFDFEELLIRIQKLLERKTRPLQNIQTDIVTIGDHKVNFKTFEILKNQKKIQLSQKEIQILRFLVNNANTVVSRQEILRAVWGYDVFPSTRTVDNFIASLRKHLEKDPKRPRYIKSVHGVGYKYESSESF